MTVELHYVKWEKPSGLREPIYNRDFDLYTKEAAFAAARKYMAEFPDRKVKIVKSGYTLAG